MHNQPRTTQHARRIVSAVAIAAAAVGLLLTVGCTPDPARTAPRSATPPPSRTATSAPAAAYVFSGVKLEKLPELQLVNVTGTVSNKGDKTYKAVMLTATLYAKGVKIAVPAEMTSNDVANDLKPGESQSFSISFGQPDPSKKSDVTKILSADEASASAQILEGMEEAR